MMHEHVYRGVGYETVMLERKDKPPKWPIDGVYIRLDMPSPLPCIVRACDCGDYYLQPVDFEDMSRIRPYPDWAKP